MTNAALNTGTWWWKRGLAAWNHRVPIADSAHPAAALCEAVIRGWSALDGFAEVATASWTTLSSGEDAVVETKPLLDPQRVRATCTKLGDPCTIVLELDLHCVGLDGADGIIEDGAKLVFDLDWPDPTDPGVGTPGLDVVFRLNADIYAPRSGARDPDNSALAALNGPRLTRFLRRLRSELGANLVDTDAYAGQGTVNADGFAPPDA